MTQKFDILSISFITYLTLIYSNICSIEYKQTMKISSKKSNKLLSIKNINPFDPKYNKMWF